MVVVMLVVLPLLFMVSAAQALQVPFGIKNDRPESSASTLMAPAVKSPKVFIVSMFKPKEEVWTSRMNFEHRLEIPGLASTSPYIRCTDNYDICQFTTGEGEINAAVSMAFLVSSPLFDLTKTYWLLAGIAGGEPSQVTTGSVTFARFAIQVGLLFQIDSKELSESYSNWTSGYFAYGTKDPWTYPKAVYGTELFELNDNLRTHVMKIAEQYTGQLKLGDTDNQALRKLYNYPLANSPPSIKACDVTTSDGYFTGEVLANYVTDYSHMLTNGTAAYCASAQEENATLEAFLRMATAGRIDFLRIIVMRSISNFARSPAGMDPLDFFLHYPKGGFDHALDNLYIAGWPIVQDIVDRWGSDYRDGKYAALNYVGDIVGRLGQKPPYGRKKYGVH